MATERRDKQRAKRTRPAHGRWAVAMGTLALYACALFVYWGLVFLRPGDSAAQTSALAVAMAMTPLALAAGSYCFKDQEE